WFRQYNPFGHVNRCTIRPRVESSLDAFGWPRPNVVVLSASSYSFARWFTLCCVWLTLGLTGCENGRGGSSSTADESTAIGASQTVLRVGITPNMPPFVYKQN